MNEIENKLGRIEENGGRVWPALDVTGGIACRRDSTRALGDGYFEVIPTGIARHIIEEKITEIQSYLAAKAASDARRRKARPNGGDETEDPKI
jgi:hypothetical protein